MNTSHCTHHEQFSGLHAVHMLLRAAIPGFIAIVTAFMVVVLLSNVAGA